MERAIHISSINREKTGENRPDDFIIKFNPPLSPDPDMKHSLAIDRLAMTYSWYNIRSDYKNNKIKYTNDRESIGIRSLSKMECIPILILMITLTSIWNKKIIIQHSQGNKKFHININFILSTYRVLITFSDDKFQLDLRETNFGELNWV